MKSKVRNLKEIIRIAERAKKQGKKIVVTNGCFDILHPGHVANLEWAKEKGDVLIVAINSDKSVRDQKGKERPINKALDRAKVLAGLEAIDYIFIFNEKSPAPAYLQIKPNIQVKGADAKRHPYFPIEQEAMKKIGGKILLAPLHKGYSTTDTINSILKKNK